MLNISQIALDKTANEDLTLVVLGLLAQGSEILNVAQVITTNTNSIVKDSIEVSIQEVSLSDEAYLKKNLLGSELWLTDISRDCENILRCITYALIGRNELVLDKLNLHTLESKYLALGIPIQFVIKVVRQMKALIAPLINNSDIAEILDGYFEDVISRLDNQDRLTILQKQNKGLARLRQQWLAEDADEQTETWNYLRDALNPDSPFYSPVSV
ncbi:hypothetical protein [Pseudanabaena minima]|uniref:hypothetical protein n=1 Tax=Pseudanabaena minima TaxID=890415 RepID=UPI003DA8D4F3